jgi:hypothetical protein
MEYAQYQLQMATHSTTSDGRETIDARLERMHGAAGPGPGEEAVGTPARAGDPASPQQEGGQAPATQEFQTAESLGVAGQQTTSTSTSTIAAPYGHPPQPMQHGGEAAGVAVGGGKRIFVCWWCN